VLAALIVYEDHVNLFTSKLYLPIDESEVKWFRITQEYNGMKRTDTCQLLGHDCSMSIHTIDEFGNEEITNQSKIAPKTWHTIRTIKPYNGQWSTYMDNIGSDEMVEGKYRNENLITNWSFDETKEFSSIDGKDY